MLNDRCEHNQETRRKQSVVSDTEEVSRGLFRRNEWRCFLFLLVISLLAIYPTPGYPSASRVP